MKKPQFKIVTEFYELPHLFGFWITDPVELDRRKEATNEEWLPRGWLFVGDRHLIQLDFVDDDEGDDVVTRGRYLVYELDGPTMKVQALARDSDGSMTKTEPVDLPWALTEDRRLNLQGEGWWWRYVPASLDDLVEAGFERNLVEGILEDFRTQGVEAVEHFDEATARKLIVDARRREDEEHGF